MQTAINVHQLSKSYGQTNIINHLNFSIQKGEVVGLLGANGAGKSTTIECLLGAQKPDQGTVSILGLNPFKDRKQLFESIGVQFQETMYQDKIQVDELCEVTSSLYQTTYDYHLLLKNFGLTNRKKHLVSELSGGERQRLFIILALIPNPAVLFLDELTTNLDSGARRIIWNHLKALKSQGVTILLTSHFLDEVAVLCDRIMILKSGSFTFCGTIQEAIDQSPYCTFEDAYLWYIEQEVECESF